MKKSILILTTLCFFAINLIAQVTVMPKVGVGLNNYKLEDKSNDFYDTKTSAKLLLGVAVDIPVSNSLSIQPELLYTKKGTGRERNLLEAPDFNFPLSTTEELPLYAHFDNEDLNYLEIPLLVKYSFVGTSFGFHVMAGPTFSFGLGGKYNVTWVDKLGDESYTPSDPTYNEVFDINNPIDVEFGTGSEDFYNKLDIGVALGGGMYIPVGSGKVNIDLRYVLGVSQMLQETDLSNDFSQKNRSLQFSIGYGFPISTVQ